MQNHSRRHQRLLKMQHRPMWMHQKSVEEDQKVFQETQKSDHHRRRRRRFTSAIQGEISAFKDTLAQEHFFETPVSGEGLSMQETGRGLLPLFAHESFNQISNHNSIDDLLNRRAVATIHAALR